MLLRTTLLVLTCGLCTPAVAVDPQSTDGPSQLVLAQLPDVHLRPRSPLNEEQAARIKKLISKLAEVDRPDVGYSQTYGGYAFLPVPGHVQMDSLTWTDHGLKSSQPLRDLVATGPDALPFLLDALGDKTHTKLTFKHRGTSDVFREGRTWFSDELSGNRLNPREARVIDTPDRKHKESEHVETYTVKVGDLCFVAVGQIVGRPYMAARYQMTSCTVINSPVEDPAFRERVRKIWLSENPTRTLFDSLWLDYRATGEPHRLGWSLGSRTQCNAALRLLYYFPQESAPVIAARLSKLDVSKAVEGSKAWDRQGIANGGVFADEFVQATCWCTVPAVRDAIRDIFSRTIDPNVFVSAIAAFDESDAGLIIKRANTLIDGLADDEWKYVDLEQVLGVTATRVGAASTSTFRRLIEKAGPKELGSLAGALKQAKGDWPIALLKPLLDDQRPTAQVYYVRDEQKKETIKVPIRVCDASAEALAVLISGERARFPAEPDRATLDKYIARLKEKLSLK